MTRRRYENQAEVDARINEIEWHRGLSLDPPLRTPQTQASVSLVKRVRIDADWCRRNRTTPEQRQKIADELRAMYGPDVRISFGAGAS